MYQLENKYKIVAYKFGKLIYLLYLCTVNKVIMKRDTNLNNLDNIIKIDFRDDTILNVNRREEEILCNNLALKTCLDDELKRQKEEIYKTIDEERDYQDKIWGNNHDKNHSVGDFTLYMKYYLDQVIKEYTCGEIKSSLDDMRKLVALGIACFEIHGVPKRKID